MAVVKENFRGINCVIHRAETKGVFTGVVFAKGCEFLLLSLKEGFGVGFRGVVGGGFPVEDEGKGEGVGSVGGVGWGPAKELASQCASFVETTL